MSSSSSGSYGWLAGLVAMGAFGGMVPIIPMPEESSRAREIRIRKEKSYEDLLKAAEERDHFTRNAQSPEGAAPVAQPKKRSKLKRAWDKLLTKLHLKKSQPVASRIDGSWREERSGMWRHAGRQPQQDELQSLPVVFHQETQARHGVSPKRPVHFDSPPDDEILFWTSTLSDDEASGSEAQEPARAYNKAGKGV